MNNQGESSIAQLIKGISKFDGTNFLPWKRSTRALISLTHPGISIIMNGGNRPVEIYSDEDQVQDTSSRRARRPTKLRPPSPARTRSKGPVREPVREEADPTGGAEKAGDDDEDQDKRTGG